MRSTAAPPHPQQLRKEHQVRQLGDSFVASRSGGPFGTEMNLIV
jgi:hypothetical protein